MLFRKYRFFNLVTSEIFSVFWKYPGQPLKCIISLCLEKKNWPRYFHKTEKISEVTIFKNQCHKNHPLADVS
jgi:hypothetical protein